MNNSTTYRGRFAPSPTGDLHLGSLAAALISYLQARTHDGVWVVRIEDIDETRTITGADQQIIQTLARFGMCSDEDIIYQTSQNRQAAYQHALNDLNHRELTFACTCNRKMLQDHSTYPGTCRTNNHHCKQPHSIRLKTVDRTYSFNDLWQGPQSANIATSGGDFNIKRKDGLFCYQLAVVLDDAAQGINEVVRGVDILDSTTRQMYLIELLGLPQPKYAHFPVITSNNQKLSKQNHAKAITHEDPYDLTHLLLSLLHQNPPQLKQKTQSKLLDWAINNWQPEKLSGLKCINY